MVKWLSRVVKWLSRVVKLLSRVVKWLSRVFKWLSRVVNVGRDSLHIKAVSSHNTGVNKIKLLNSEYYLASVK